MTQDEEFEDEPLEEEPEEVEEAWHPPVPCAQCGSPSTRFVTRNYELSVYECEVCGAQFEAEG